MIRYGILGFGLHAVRRLVPAFNTTQDSTLAGLWRRDREKAQADSVAFGIEHVFSSPDELCASPEIDAVFVASPDALHLPHVLVAANHGKPILCEKPLGMNAGEVESMIAAARDAGVVFGVAQNFRYNRSLTAMRAWIAEGRIGAPVLAHAQFSYEAEKSPRTWIYNPNLACGGPIGDVGIHCVDALRFVLGNTAVTAVSTLARGDANSGAVEAVASTAIEFASGAMGAVTVTTRARYRSLVEVVGESGVLLCENGMTVEHPVQLVLQEHGEIKASETISNADGYTLMLDAFARTIEGRGSYLATGEDGLHNQQVIDAMYRSWRTGMRQSIPPLASSSQPRSRVMS
jgi:predicted dehydrogenase